MADIPRPIPSPDYATFAQQLYRTNIISDPWIEGRERFRLQPLFLPEQLYRRFQEAAEAIGRAYDELARIVWEQPELLQDYFGLTPYQKLMWLASEGRWHGIARLDLFVLADDAIQICEMNSDTPSGEAETVVINHLLHPFHPGAIDPNARFKERFVRMALDSYQASAGTAAKEYPSIGILYPTDMPEDLSMIAMYRQWFEERGCQVTLGSPYNIHPAPLAGVALFETPIDIMIRHYKTDWWGERIPAWTDEADYDDPEPLAPQLRLLLDADAAGALTLINPFGGVVTQNKLTMAFLWNNLDRLSPESAAAIRAYIPETHRLADVDPERLVKQEWVLKSDYGCEGDEVIIGHLASDEIWRKSLAAAVPERWIVQRYFHAQPDTQGLVPNYGVYLIAGETAGVFTRLAPGSTDYTAMVPPTFILPKQGEQDGTASPEDHRAI